MILAESWHPVLETKPKQSTKSYIKLDNISQAEIENLTASKKHNTKLDFFLV